MFIEGVYLSSFNILFTPFQLKYNLESLQVSIISSLIFIAVGLGSASISYLYSIGTRIKIINMSLLLLSGFSILMGLVENYILFSLFRFLVGYFIGLTIPVIVCIITEYLPLYLRSFLLSTIWITFIFGVLTQLIVVQIVSPVLDPNKFHLIFLYMAVPNFIITFIYIFFLEDSPRNLILNNDEDHGFEILESIAQKNITEEEKLRILKEVKFGENSKSNSDGIFLSLFNEKNFLTTILLVLICIIGYYILYSPMIIMEFTMKKLGLDSKEKNLIVKLILVNAISIIGFFLGGILSEITFIGRKICIIIGFVVFSILNLFSFLFYDYFDIFLGFEQIFSHVAVQIVGVYAYEYYNTKDRDSANGYLFACGRISSFFSQFIGIKLDKINLFLPYYTNVTVSFIAAILVFSLPYDTYGHYLDSCMEKEKEKEKNI